MAPMALDKHGVAGLYRFHDAKSEEQYRVRLMQWCFWPAVVHLTSTLVYNVISLVSYVTGSGGHPPVYIWWLLVVDVASLVLLVALCCSKFCRRHVGPLLCLFICLEMAQYAAFIGFHTKTWTDSSYAYIVPASSTVYVEGPSGRVDVSAQLRGHFAVLAAYRAAQIAFSLSLSCWIFNALMGLNYWSIATNLAIPTALAVGMLTSPEIPPTAPVIYVAIAFAASTLSLLFSVAFERIQRRNFESERLLHWELQASQMADSVLNHSLKNTLADVAGNIEMFLAGALESKVLEDCIVSLRRGMRSCKERQVYLQLVAGQYQPVLNAINLQDFGCQLLAGRSVKGQFPDCTIYADNMLLTLIFDNALSNAAKHGDPQGPDVTFTIEEIPADVCPDLPAGKRRFCFQVTNVAHPGRPGLTPQYVTQLFAGKAGQSQEELRGVSTLSDRIGLTHCVMAAKLGGIAISLTQEDDLVTFAGRLDAEVPAAPADRRPSHRYALAPPAAPAFPPGLQYVVLDDSLPAQRLLQFHINQLCAPSAIVCLGTNVADVDAFMANALLADVIVVDQHLVWDKQEFLGTDLVRQLRRVQYTGFVCIRSADDGPADQALYRQAGANCSVGKDLLGPVMVQQMGAAYHEFMKQKHMVSEMVPPANELSDTETVAVSVRVLSELYETPVLALTDADSDALPPAPAPAPQACELDVPSSSSCSPFLVAPQRPRAGHPLMPLQGDPSCIELLTS